MRAAPVTDETGMGSAVFAEPAASPVCHRVHGHNSPDFHSPVCPGKIRPFLAVCPKAVKHLSRKCEPPPVTDETGMGSAVFAEPMPAPSVTGFTATQPLFSFPGLPPARYAHFSRCAPKRLSTSLAHLERISNLRML